MGIGLYQSGTYVRSGKTGETPLAYAQYVEGKYALQKEKLRQEFSEKAIKQNLANTFLSTKSSSLADMQDFFYFLDDIKYEVIQKALTNFNFQDVTQEINGEKIVLDANMGLTKNVEISQSTKELQELLDAMELILTQPLLQQNQKLYENIQKIVTPEAIKGAINQITPISSSDDIKLIINQTMDSIMKNNGGLNLQKAYRGSEEARQQISTFIRVYLKKQIFQQYLNQAQAGVSINIKSSVLKGFVRGLIVNIKTVLGYFAQDELTKELRNQLYIILGKDWGAQVIGEKYNQSGHRSTSDIAFTKNGILVKLPGISMKTFSANTKQVSHNLRVKSEETNLGELIKPLSGLARNFIYNLLALAGTRVSGRGRKIYSNQEDTQEMYDLMHKMLVIRGLIGGMTEKDFAYYFVFNKKVYTIFEIVSDLLNNENLSSQLFGVRPSNVTFTPSRTQISKYNQWVGKENVRDENEAIQRSNAFKEYVNSNVKVGLTLKYNLLKLG